MSDQKCRNVLAHLDWCGGSISGQGGLDNLVRFKEGRDEDENEESDNRTDS